MRIFKTKDFWETLLKDDWLEKFVEHGWCWNGCKTNHPTRIRDFLLISVGWLSNSKPEVHQRLRLLLNARGVKGVNTFQMPEQIGWCACEPRCSQHKKNKDEFYGILYNLYDIQKKELK